jgi:hypothetical protein
MSVAMPKTAVDENRYFASGKDNVWATWKIVPMQTEPQTHSMQLAPHDQLRACIARTNTRH